MLQCGAAAGARTCIGRRSTDRANRSAQKKQKACVLWFTGLSGAGKSTIANLVEKKLFGMGRHTYLLDGDNIRHGLNRDLGFTDADRVENIRRVGEVARLMTDAGLIVLVSFISPFRSGAAAGALAARCRRVLRDLRRYAARGRRSARSQGPVPQGARRQDPQLHRHRLAVRAAGESRDPHRHRARERRAGRRARDRPAARRRRDRPRLGVHPVAVAVEVIDTERWAELHPVTAIA